MLSIRKWSAYISIIIIAVILGLGSRHFAMYLPRWINLYFGDFLWAFMIFFLMGLIFCKKNTRWVIIFALGYCYLIEISQIYHSPWFDALRQTRLGGLTLGRGFLWSDLISYTFGIAIGAVIETHMFLYPIRD